MTEFLIGAAFLLGGGIIMLSLFWLITRFGYFIACIGLVVASVGLASWIGTEFSGKEVSDWMPILTLSGWGMILISIIGADDF